MRPIDADKLIENIENTADLGGWIGDTLRQIKRLAVRYINSAPSIDIEPKQGEWIVYEGGWKDLDYYPPKCKCNQCGYEEELYILNAKPTNFCPNCGADMREREGE